MQTTLQELKEGDQFKLAEGNYIKTNMIHRETDCRYCCNLKSGVMYVFPEDTEVDEIVPDFEEEI